MRHRFAQLGVVAFLLFGAYVVAASPLATSVRFKRSRLDFNKGSAGFALFSSSANVTHSATTLLERELFLEQAHLSAQALLCKATIPKLPWKNFYVFLSAQENAAKRIGSISEIPLNSTVFEWTLEMISSNASALEAHKDWLAATKVMAANNSLTSCFDTVKNLELIASSRHAALSRLEREKAALEHRLPAGFLSLSQSSQQTQNAESFMALVGTFVRREREMLNAARRDGSESQSLGAEAASMVKAMFDGMIQSMEQTEVPGPTSLSASTPSSSSTVARSVDPRTRITLLEVGDRDFTSTHQIDWRKCKAKCYDVVKEYAVAPKLRLKAIAKATTSAINGALNDPARTLLGNTLFNDVQAANLAYAKLISNAIMTYEPTKAVVLTWFDRVFKFLRFVEINDHRLPGDVSTRPWAGVGFWPYFLAARVPNFRPSLDGTANADGAGDTGPSIATLDDVQDLAEEGNLREILTLMYRLIPKLVDVIVVVTEWADMYPSQKHLVFNNQMLDEATIRAQLGRVEKNGVLEDFCVPPNQWVFAPMPGFNGYLKRNCNPDAANPAFRFFVDHERPHDNVKRVPFAFMDEVNPPLSDREIAYLYDANIPQSSRSGVRLCRFVNQLRKGHRLVPWRSGGDVALHETEPLQTGDSSDVRQSFFELCKEAGMIARGGPSGTTDLFILAAKYFGVAGLDLVHFRNAIAAWMELANDHSFHEVLLAAEPYGLPYSSWLSDEGRDSNQEWERALTWVYHAELLNGGIDKSLTAPFKTYLAKLHSIPGFPAGELNCAPAHYLEAGHINRRALQWWYFNGYASPPSLPTAGWCIKPTPRREVPTGFIPADTAVADRIGYLQVKAYATPSNQLVTIELGFYHGAPNIRVVEHGSNWNGFAAICITPKKCVTAPTRTLRQWDATMTSGFGVAINHAATDPTVVSRDIPLIGPLACVSLHYNGAKQYVCSYEEDITLLSHGIATMKQTPASSTFADCASANLFLKQALASAPDQVTNFYRATETEKKDWRFDTPLFHVDHNVVDWATARAFICSSSDSFQWFTRFVKAAARCPITTPSADPTAWAADSHMELCTEGSLRTHSFRCAFGPGSPLCKTDLYWWRELAHRTAVCFYTHDTLYGHFNRVDLQQPTSWAKDALAVMNDMARHPCSQSYFPPFTDSIIFSGFGAGAEYFSKLPIQGTFRLDWRSFARTPDIAWRFGNSRKGVEAIGSAMLVLVNTPSRRTPKEALSRARSLRNSFRIFDNQAEILMPPAIYRVLGRKSFYCETALSSGIPLAEFARPIGPYAEVYVEWQSWTDYGDDPAVVYGA